MTCIINQVIHNNIFITGSICTCLHAAPYTKDEQCGATVSVLLSTWFLTLVKHLSTHQESSIHDDQYIGLICSFWDNLHSWGVQGILHFYHFHNCSPKKCNFYLKHCTIILGLTTLQYTNNAAPYLCVLCMDHQLVRITFCLDMQL